MDDILTTDLPAGRQVEKIFFTDYLDKINSMKKYILFIILISLCKFSFAQEESPYIKMSFVIIQSTKNYTEAKATANKAAKALKLKLDFRNLKPHKTAGLTDAKKECEDNGWEYPCYVSRGRYDNGEYVSIEWSNAFAKFAKGYYIVIVYSGEKQDSKASLKKTKKVFADAYAKEAEVYMGCMH